MSVAVATLAPPWGDRLDWRKTRQRILVLARACGAPAAIADDVAQEVALKAWARLDTFEPRRGSFDAWLRSITHSEVCNQLRHERAVRRAAAGARPRDATDPRPALDAALTVEALATRLTAREREALRLTVLVGCGSEEAAPRLGVTPATVRSLKRNALIRLYDLASDAPTAPGLSALRSCSRWVK
jgi:RNA polymerase sigma-70 factor (ECF subfamily)